MINKLKEVSASEIFSFINAGATLSDVAKKYDVSSIAIHKKIKYFYERPKKKAIKFLERESFNISDNISFLLKKNRIKKEETNLPASIPAIFEKKGTKNIILINKNIEEDNYVFILAHILGHVVLKHHHVLEDGRHTEKISFFEKNQVENKYFSEEIQANIFALNLVIPEKILKSKIKSSSFLEISEIKDLSTYFKVPETVLMRRLHGMNYSM